jgi:HEAT repeat protein
MALGTAAVLLLAAMAWFVGAVVVPLWQVRRAVVSLHASFEHANQCGGFSTEDQLDYVYNRVIDRLGGPQKRARQLHRYLRLPDTLAPHKHVAIGILGRCEGHELSALVEALRGSDAVCRWWATDALRYLGPKAASAAPVLAAGLKDPDPTIRIYAAWALGSIGPDAMEAIPKLLALCEDPDQKDNHAAHPSPDFDFTRLRARAMRSLGQIDRQGRLVLPTLEKALAHDDIYVREAAGDALAEIGPAAKSTAPALLRNLEDKEKATSAASLAYWRATGEMDRPLDYMCRELQSRDWTEWRLELCVNWPSRIFYNTLKEIAPAVGTQPEPTQLKFISALVPFLLSRTFTTREEAKHLAASLYPADSPEAIAIEDWDVTHKIIGEKRHGMVSSNALDPIGGPERAIHKLTLYMRLPGWVAPDKSAAALLLIYCSDEAPPGLLDALASPDVETRRAAIRPFSLGFAEDRATAALVKALSDVDADVRMGAACAFDWRTPLSDEARAALTKTLADPDGDVRIAAAFSLIETCNGHTGAMRTLIECLKVGDDKARCGAADVLGSCLTASHDAVPRTLSVPADDGGSREWTVSVRGEMGPETAAAIVALRKASAEDESPKVRQAAAEALKKIRDVKESPATPSQDEGR